MISSRSGTQTVGVYHGCMRIQDLPRAPSAICFKSVSLRQARSGPPQFLCTPFTPSFSSLAFPSLLTTHPYSSSRSIVAHAPPWHWIDGLACPHPGVQALAAAPTQQPKWCGTSSFSSTHVEHLAVVLGKFGLCLKLISEIGGLEWSVCSEILEPPCPITRDGGSKISKQTDHSKPPISLISFRHKPNFPNTSAQQPVIRKTSKS
jgi:hypothetical protein